MSSSCAKSLLQCELPADDQPLNLGSAFVDLANPDIAIDPRELSFDDGRPAARSRAALQSRASIREQP